MKNLFYIALYLLMLPLGLLAQSDSMAVFTQQQLLWYIENYHPVSQQADLLAKKGESSVRRARGAFDPFLFSDLDQKQFDDKQYFSILNSGLKVPTWYGIELKTGFEKNSGVFLNPENNLPPGGQWNAGISVPIGQGLIMDKRRATLKQAKLFAQSTEAERQKLMNDLYFAAVQQYWEWVAAWNQLQVYEESVVLAQTRFEAVKISNTQGDVPAIDTLEAFILVQNREMNRNQFTLLYQNITLDLSNYLWYEDNIPLEITDSLRPPALDDLDPLDLCTLDTLQIWIDQLVEFHPEMMLYDYKLSMMDIERRLKVEGLKPQLDFNYNVLNEPVGGNFVSDLTLQNYKWGFEFSFPLLVRQARGDLQLTKLKIQETELQQDQKLLQLQNKVRQYYNEQLNLQDQVALYTNAVSNYQSLLNGERRKFDLGESSLFLVNSRENNLISASLKLIELQTKYFKAYNGLRWAAGILHEGNNQ